MSEHKADIIIPHGAADMLGNLLKAIDCLRALYDEDKIEDMIAQRTSYAIACVSLVFIDVFQQFAVFPLDQDGEQ